MKKIFISLLLSVTLIFSGLSIIPLKTTAATNPQLKVDLSVNKGEMLNGGAGFLYGMSEPNVPDINTIIPLKPNTTVQKAPDGLQHPNGDALKVSDYFLEAGGEQIQIYVQDIYEQWPYEFTGIPDYLDKVESVAKKVVENPNKDKFVYVPFNEPDHIWYGGMSAETQKRFFSDWKTVVEKIKSIDPHARIAGPNFASYNESVYYNFFKFAKENDVLPDVVTWHELGDDFFSGWNSRYSQYRSIEKELGFGPLEISINEYARPRDPSNQGALLQFLAKFERSKVLGSLPYWHMSDNLNDLVVENNKVNGAWWLYKWTGEMKGKQTVQVTPPNENAFGLEGIATLDRSKKQAQIVFGGKNGSTDIAIEGIDSQKYFGNKVHVTVWESPWTGFDGAAANPTVVHEKDYSVTNGQINISISDMNEMSAYKAIITPATAKTTYPKQPWNKTYEAEDGTLSGKSTIYDLENSGAYIEWPTSGGKQVGGIDDQNSGVKFTVNVPEDGKYLMDVYYGNGPLGPEESVADRRKTAKHLLTVDNELTKEIEYPANVGFKFIGVKKVYLDLKAGEHTLKFSGMPVMQDGQLTRVALLDRVDLTYTGEYKGAVIPDTHRYEGEYAELKGKSRIETKNDNYSGTGYLDLSQDKSSVMFVVNVEKNGYYETNLRYSTSRGNSKVDYYIDRKKVKELKLDRTGSKDDWETHSVIRYLKAGINLIELKNAKHNLNIDYLNVKEAPNAAKGSISVIEAEDKGNTIAGAAKVQENPYASGDKHVGFIGKGAENYLQFNNITVPKSGKYKLVVHYSNNEQKGNHSYNANLVERHAEISVNKQDAERIYFKNTYSWETFRSIVLDVDLKKGNNTIRFNNDTMSPDYEQYAPDIDKIEVAPAETSEPSLMVHGPHTVKVNDSFSLSYAVNDGTEKIRFLKMNLKYDPEKMEFVSVVPLNKKLHIKTTKSGRTGEVNIYIKGAPGHFLRNHDLFKVNMAAKETEKSMTNIKITDIALKNNRRKVTLIDPVTQFIHLFDDVSEINIIGKNGLQSITDNRGALQLSAEVKPANADQLVNWSVTDLDGTNTELATISSEGLLSANNKGLNGKVKVVAEAMDGSGTSADRVVEIKNQLVSVNGTPFGKNPPWAPGGEFDKAFDGDIHTFYDYSKANGGYTGIDLGEDNQAVVKEFRYYPRAGYTERMVGGKIQGSNISPTEGFVDLYTINSNPELSWNVVQLTTDKSYRYLRYVSPDGGYGNIAELEFFTEK
ncbi:carbohydrate-binding protein [Halobacillus salinarum]|uniref:Carbohydrate-binding protein n=1 Tax=Halobacillus salinarum TaxID=2932257 RepID=A0ABY4EHU9_9BACI|nr:CBM35 domain-containing protein [Halobacillus salinarum]UOQ44049.1 carbohydrate-binding protein [Halobacillus salinarum]